jgi:hypothetical protein
MFVLCWGRQKSQLQLLASVSGSVLSGVGDAIVPPVPESNHINGRHLQNVNPRVGCHSPLNIQGQVYKHKHNIKAF